MLLIFLYKKEKEKCPAYITKINPSYKKQVILLMIPNEENEGWHYPAVKNYVHYRFLLFELSSFL